MISKHGCSKLGTTLQVQPVAPIETIARFQAGCLSLKIFIVFHRFSKIFFDCHGLLFGWLLGWKLCFRRGTEWMGRPVSTLNVKRLFWNEAISVFVSCSCCFHVSCKNNKLRGSKMRRTCWWYRRDKVAQASGTLLCRDSCTFHLMKGTYWHLCWTKS